MEQLYLNFPCRAKQINLLDELLGKVLDGIENLNDSTSGNSLAVFSKLQEMTSIYSLSVIFISKVLPEKFYIDSSYIPVYFPQYTRDDYMTILKFYRPPECEEQFFENYLNSALTVFIRTTRDFIEMKNLILSNFPTYCEPVKKGDISSNDVVGLWRHIVPHLKESLNNVYLGVICRKNDETINNTTDLTAHSSKTLCAFDLPYYAKYFLIASYLASYNSPKYDRRLFLKNHGKHKKKNLRIKIKENITNELLGPKPFSLDRLLAIFYAIMEEKASLTVNLMSQIASLVELRLLAKLGDSCIEKPKYKCLVGFECVDVVAKTLGFNLKKYLLE
ncbi:origin recognition complex subunit 5 isoform X2 [Rhodnius prolixus]|uniref:origin recognition complex subunit 5 isoform X2 n=1 Tax=Rhodnius prolixus TaxID=13249 RepID=UPI003D1886A9